MKMPKVTNPVNDKDLKVEKFPSYVFGVVFGLVVLATGQGVLKMLAPTIGRVPMLDTKIEPFTSQSNVRKQKTVY